MSDYNIINAEQQINKLTQLILHAGLGALTNTITGNDALSGAVSAVSGEIVSDYVEDGDMWIGETLFDDDYVNRKGDEINFNTKIGRALGEDGLYGDNAEEMIGALINFEIGGSFKNGDEDYPYVDFLGIMTTGIGININTQSKIKQVEFVDKNGNTVNNDLLFKNLSNIKNKYVKNQDNFEIKNGIRQLKSGVIGEINKEFSKLGYKITQYSKYSAFVDHIKKSRNSLNRQFSNYNGIPTSSKMGLTNMIYNIGEGNFKKQYKNLSNAVENYDWIRAGDESKISDIQKPRNEWNKKIIQQGDINNTNIINNYKYKKDAK